MKLSLLLVTLSLWLYLQSTDAQIFHFKQYALEEGLPQSEVTSMAEDQFGYLWVGTNGGGLCRFNGKDFEVFTKKDGLFDNIILGLLHDEKYNLWIATQKGIQYYDGISYQTVIHSDTTLFSDNVDFCETSDGNTWCLARMISGERRLYHFNDTIVTDISQKLNKELSDKGPIYSILPDSKNGLLITTAKQLLTFNNNKLKPYESFSRKDNKVRLPLLRDRNKNLWMMVIDDDNSHELIIHIDGKGIKKIKLPQEVQGSIIFKGFQDREGTYWFIIENGGLLQYNKNGWQTFNKNNGLPINLVYNILQDAEGNIWIGTLGAGLVRYSGNLFVSLNRNNGLTDNIIRAIYQDSNGTYYFADGEGGFSTLKGQKIIAYNKIKLPQLKAIKEFYELPSGNILLATMNGLWEFDGNTVKSVNEQFGWKKHLPISDIVVQQDTFFFSTYKHGLIKSHKGKATFYNTYNSNMQDNTILHILSDSKQRLWLSTGRGITLYKKGKFTQYLEGRDIESSYVLQAAEDKIGNIWFATFTDGLIRYDNENWSVFDSKSGLSGDNIYSIIADKDGNLFAGAQSGVDKLSISSGGDVISVTNFDKYDGFIGIENNGAANFLDKKGHIWFGTIKGVMRYNPMEKRTNFLSPNIYIRDIELSYKKPNWQSKEYAMAFDSIVPWFGIPDQLNLSSDDNNISFTFDALCFSVPEKVKFRWRLEPLEYEWIEGTSNNVAYPSLPSGNYTFRVSAANNSNIWNDEGAIYQFNIHPKWYRTAFFRAFIILLILVLLIALIFSWQQRTKMLKFEMETLLTAKTKEINNQKEEIEKQNEKLRQQKEKIKIQADAINGSLGDLEKLTDIGQVLTTNLSTDSIFDHVHKAASEVMDTYLFGVGLFNQETNSLDFNNLILKGERMPFLTFPLEDIERLSVHCLIKDKEIFINDFDKEYKKYVQEIRPVPDDINSKSIIYIPLKVSGEPFGVLTVQSADKKTYSRYHLSFMRNISLYTSIALENAKAFNQLEKQHRSLESANKKVLEQNELIHKQQADVEQLNKENNHLIALFTQEIERSITSSITLINSIKTESDIDENEKDEALQFVFDALWQIKKMVNQANEIKRLKSIAINTSQVPVLPLMRKVVAQCNSFLKEKEINIKWNVIDEIIQTDYTVLETIISNLLSNAIKFTYPESSITLTAQTVDKHLEISITDEGPGIEQKTIPDLFKLKTYISSNQLSSGLGLYLVKRYTDHIGGAITCASTVGKGTTFKITLPK